MKNILIAVALLTSATAANANLITNGNFETGNLSGWTAVGNVGTVALPFFGFSAPAYGNYIAAFNPGNVAANGSLSQAIATVAGLSYTFAYNYGDNGSGQSVIASVLDSSMALLGTETVFSNSTAIQAHGFSFTAMSGSTIIRFQDVVTNNTFNQDGAIDNVSVNADAVPEPAMLGLFGFGAIGLGLSRRRTAA